MPSSARPHSRKNAPDRVALVTGGSQGIGAACVSRFRAAGWRVSVLALPSPELDQLASSGLLTFGGDVTSPSIRERAVSGTLGSYGRIDVLINNAGIGLYSLPTASSVQNLTRLFEVNVIAPLALAQLVIPLMRQQAGGVIVNVGSVASAVSLPWCAVYCASKSALHSFHDSLRRELRGSPVHLIEVFPGIVDTEFRDHVLAGSPPPSVRDIRWIVSAGFVAERILRAVERRRRTVYVPRIGAIFSLAGTLAPWLMDIYLARLLKQHGPVASTLKTSLGSEEPS